MAAQSSVYIPLRDRNIKIRLGVAVIYYAYADTSRWDNANPGRTHKRWMHMLGDEMANTATNLLPWNLQLWVYEHRADGWNSTQSEGGLMEAYHQMWFAIAHFYRGMSWYSMCDENITKKIQDCFSKGLHVNDTTWKDGIGFSHHLQDKTVSPEEIKKSIDHWNQSGWTDYEMNRAKKMANMAKLATSSASIGASITLKCLGMNAFD